MKYMEFGKSWDPTVRVIAAIIIGIVVGLVVWFFRELIRPLIIGGLFAYTIRPGVNYLSRKTKLSHKSSVVIVYVISILVFSAIPGILAPVFIHQIELLEIDFVQLLAEYQRFLKTPIYFREWAIYPEKLLPDISGLTFNVITPIAGSAFRVVEIVTKNFAWVLIVVVATYYLLKDWEKLYEWILTLPPEEYKNDVIHLIKDLDHIWAAYIRSQLLFMIIVGIFDAIVWVAIGLPGAVILAFITGVTSIVPELGAFFSGLLSVSVAFLEGSTYMNVSNVWFAIIVLFVYFVLTNIKNIWIRPIVIGRGVHIHEGIVFVVVLGALIIDGPLMAFISVPLLMSILTVGKYLRQRIYGLSPFPGEMEAESVK